MNQFLFSNQTLLNGATTLGTGAGISAVTGSYIPAARARKATLTYFPSGTLGGTTKLTLQYPSPFQNNVGLDIVTFTVVGDTYLTTGITLTVPEIRAIVTGTSGTAFCSLFEQN